MCGLLKE